MLESHDSYPTATGYSQESKRVLEVGQVTTLEPSSYWFTPSDQPSYYIDIDENLPNLAIGNRPPNLHSSSAGMPEDVDIVMNGGSFLTYDG